MFNRARYQSTTLAIVEGLNRKRRVEPESDDSARGGITSHLKRDLVIQPYSTSYEVLNVDQQKFSPRTPNNGFTRWPWGQNRQAIDGTVPSEAFLQDWRVSAVGQLASPENTGKKTDHVLRYSLEDFHASSSLSLPPHLQVYTWPTCTLRELSHLLTTALPNLLPEPAVGTRLSYRLIFPDTRDSGRPGPGRYLSKELGSVVLGGDDSGILPSNEEAANVVAGGPMAAALGGEPEKTLQEARFVIGDYISCAVFLPLPNGSVAPAPTPGPSGRAGGFGRGGNTYSTGRNEPLGPPRENGFGDFRVRGSARAFSGDNGIGSGGVPSGEWRRGERVPDGSPGEAGYGRGRGRGRFGY